MPIHFMGVGLKVLKNFITCDESGFESVSLYNLLNKKHNIQLFKSQPHTHNTHTFST